MRDTYWDFVSVRWYQTMRMMPPSTYPSKGRDDRCVQYRRSLGKRFRGGQRRYRFSGCDEGRMVGYRFSMERGRMILIFWMAGFV